MIGNITFDSIIKQKLPGLKLGVLLLNVKVEKATEELQQKIDNAVEELGTLLNTEKIREQKNVKASKDAYRTLGKDPNRYRPSAEALLRRVASGKGLYQINNVVDLLNFVSIKSGYSIGGYDADKIEGEIILGIGEQEEPYKGIGRGDLNIEKLPVFRDDQGAFGSPTSDSVRTMVTEQTKRFIMIFLDFSGGEQLESILTETADLYENMINSVVVDKYIVG